MTSLTKRLTGEGTGQLIEYEEESVHNMPTAAWNAIISIAKKVKDNALHMMTTQVIVLQSTMPQTPTANPQHTLLRVPNAFIIK